MNKTILVVDDTPTNLQVLLGFLTESGLRALVAQDGASALEQIIHGRPDLILLDVTMPEMDGFETCRRIKRNPETRDIPILFLTARGEISDKIKGFEAGAVDYITKPIQKEEVIARVNTHLMLVEQKARLQDMLKERERFMRIAAHDLRNLLTVVNGYAELGPISESAQARGDCFNEIRKAGTQMKAIIDDFLELHVLSRGKAENLEAFDLHAVVRQVLEQSAYAAQIKGIEILSQVPDEPLRAKAILAHTHQILSNYVSNALKYSPRQTRITVSVRQRDNFWRLEVRDQGPGIRSDERNKLFVEFAKISNKPTGGETSTGIGLAIVKALAEAQGGRVGAEFPEAGGSLFWLELPASPNVSQA